MRRVHLLTLADGPLARLAAASATTQGVFTTADALAAGLTERGVQTAASAAWHRLGRGVFIDRDAWLELTARERHLRVARARLCELGAGWHLARRTAVVAHGLPLLGSPPPRPLLLRDKATPSDRGRNRFERRAALPEQDRAEVDGLPCTALPRAVVDLAREETPMSALVVADAALRGGLDREVLDEQVRRSAHWPGGLAAARVVAWADGLAERPIESVSRARMVLAGLPLPEFQVNVFLGARLLGRVDFLWRAHNLIGEADGKGKYLVDPERGYVEKLRDEAFEDVGLEVAHWPWSSAYRDDGDLVAKVRRGMERGARNVLDPRVRFVPTTLADARRSS